MKKHLVILATTAGLAAFEAGAAAPSLDQLISCTGIADSSARLACFDREVAPLARQAPGPARPATTAPAGAAVAAAPSAPPAAAPAPAAAPPPARPSSFGQEHLAVEKRQAAEDEKLHARLTSQKAAGGGFFNLYLDNGQLWRHQDPVLGAYLREGDAVTIEKGALGSYKLSRDEGKSRNWIRVTRVR